MCFWFCISTIWKSIGTNRANRLFLQTLWLSLLHASCWTLANRKLIRLKMWPSLQCILSGDALNHQNVQYTARDECWLVFAAQRRNSSLKEPCQTDLLHLIKIYWDILNKNIMWHGFISSIYKKDIHVFEEFVCCLLKIAFFWNVIGLELTLVTMNEPSMKSIATRGVFF